MSKAIELLKAYKAGKIDFDEVKSGFPKIKWVRRPEITDVGELLRQDYLDYPLEGSFEEVYSEYKELITREEFDSLAALVDEPV